MRAISIDHKYLSGRYGAVPFFGELPDNRKHTLTPRSRAGSQRSHAATV